MEFYQINEIESKTIKLLKGIFALMVILIHVNGNGINLVEGSVSFQHPAWFVITKEVLSQIITLCAVPGFFVLSSLMLYKKDIEWKNNTLKKIKSLLIPYLFVNTFWIVFYAVAQSIPFLSNFFSDPNKIVAKWGIMEYLNAYLGFSDNYGVKLLYAPLWFLRDLFVLNLLFKVIKKIIDKMPAIIFVVLIFITVFDVDTHLFCLQQKSLVYFCLGYYLIKYNIHFDTMKINSLILNISYIIITLIRTVITDSPIIDMLVIVIGFLFWYRFANFVRTWSAKKRLIFDIVSEYSFAIFLIHYIPSAIIIKLLYVIFPKNEIIFIIEYFISIPIVLGISIGISVVLKSFFSPIYKVLIGKI